MRGVLKWVGIILGVLIGFLVIAFAVIARGGIAGAHVAC